MTRLVGVQRFGVHGFDVHGSGIQRVGDQSFGVASFGVHVRMYAVCLCVCAPRCVCVYFCVWGVVRAPPF